MRTEPGDEPRPRLRRLATDDLASGDVAQIRALLFAAFGMDEEERFTEDDWQHALGGTHVIAEIGGQVVGHASVVERTLRVGAVPVRTAYVEAVATAPELQGRGIGTAVMAEIGAIIRTGYQLGALGTGAHGFYERLGWRTWQGPTSVLTPEGERRTPDEDGFIMVLPTPASLPLDLTAPISCESRAGDAW